MRKGGAVAMNINSDDVKLVLLCPAWKEYGTAKTVKPDTVILHSKADDVIPFADSERSNKWSAWLAIPIPQYARSIQYPTWSWPSIGKQEMVPTNSSPTRTTLTMFLGSSSAFAQCESNASLVRGIVTAMRFDSGSSCMSYMRGKSFG
jgi:hypothetical protein